MALSDLLCGTETVRGRLAAVNIFAPVGNSHYAYRGHEDHSSWSCGLATVARQKHNRQPLFFAYPLEARETSASPHAKDNKKRSCTIPTFPWGMADRAFSSQGSGSLTSISVRASQTIYFMLRRTFHLAHYPTLSLRILSSFFLCFALLPSRISVEIASLS
jgi:hypothetical protein